jgi:hypothetical protein
MKNMTFLAPACVFVTPAPENKNKTPNMNRMGKRRKTLSYECQRTNTGD